MKYKFLRTGLKSNSGNLKWRVGKWNHIDELEICQSGLHCSKTPYQAFSFVQGEVLAIVETKGKSIIQDDKECWSDMKIVKTYKWTKKDSVAFAIYAAELVIKNYEKEYPNDKRPREAIEAAKKVLFHDTAKNRSAADSAAYSAYSAADSAYSAYSAAYSARSAADSARSAADSAYSAADSARSAADSAYSADSADSAAYSAAYSATYKKLGLWMIKRIKLLKPIK
jgi:hypothetical protein